MEKLDILKHKTLDSLYTEVYEFGRSEGNPRSVYKKLMADEVEFLRANKDEYPWTKLNTILNQHRPDGFHLSVQHMVAQANEIGLLKNKAKSQNFVSKKIPSQFFNYREINRYYKI